MILDTPKGRPPTMRFLAQIILILTLKTQLNKILYRFPRIRIIQDGFRAISAKFSDPEPLRHRL